MTTPLPPDAARAAFEAELRGVVPASETYSLKRNAHGKYVAAFVEQHWQMWSAAYRLMAKDAERLDWVVQHGDFKVQGSDERGWGVFDCRNGLTILMRDAKTYRAAIDAAISAVMSKKCNAARLQAICDAWNEANPVGTRVVCLRDVGPVFTTTRSVAQVLSGHTPVIWLVGISGCYDLKCVKPVSAVKGEKG